MLTRGKGGARISTPLKVQGKRWNDTLVDTGAEVTLIRFDELETLREEGKVTHPLRHSPYRVSTASCQPLPIRGLLDLEYTFTDERTNLSYTILHETLVVDRLDTSLLLGMDCLSRIFAHIQLSDGTLSIRADLQPDGGAPRGPDAGNHTVVTTVRSVCLKSNGVTHIPLTFDRRLYINNESLTMRFEPAELQDDDGEIVRVEFDTPKELKDAHVTGRLTVSVRNDSDEEWYLRKGTVVGMVIFELKGRDTPLEDGEVEQEEPVTLMERRDRNLHFGFSTTMRTSFFERQLVTTVADAHHSGDSLGTGSEEMKVAASLTASN